MFARFKKPDVNEAEAFFDDGNRPFRAVNLKAWPERRLDAVGRVKEGELGGSKIEHHQRAVVDLDVNPLALKFVNRVVSHVAAPPRKAGNAPNRPENRGDSAQAVHSHVDDWAGSSLVEPGRIARHVVLLRTFVGALDPRKGDLADRSASNQRLDRLNNRKHRMLWRAGEAESSFRCLVDQSGRFVDRRGHWLLGVDVPTGAQTRQADREMLRNRR